MVKLLNIRKSDDWKKVPKKGDENISPSMRNLYMSFAQLKKSPQERGRKPCSVLLSCRYSKLKKSPQERGRKLTLKCAIDFCMHSNWKKVPKKGDENIVHATHSWLKSLDWKKVPKKGDENQLLNLLVRIKMRLLKKDPRERGRKRSQTNATEVLCSHYWKKVPEEGDENIMASSCFFMASISALKKSPRGRGRRQNCLLLRWAPM